MDFPSTFRNIVQSLQADPFAYKRFGIWWWPVKALLREAGYADQLELLGPYQDAEVGALVPREGLEATIRAALVEYRHNAQFGRPGGVVEDPDGQLVTIWDADAPG